MKKRNSFWVAYWVLGAALPCLFTLGCEEKSVKDYLFQACTAPEEVSFTGEQVLIFHSPEPGKDRSYPRTIHWIAPDKYAIETPDVIETPETRSSVVNKGQSESVKITFSTETGTGKKLYPPLQLTTQRVSFPRFSAPRLLQRNYRVLLGDQKTTIAGRKAANLKLIPRKEDRSSFSLWLDDETGVILRFEEEGCDGKKLVSFFYEEILYDPPFTEEVLENSSRLPKPSKSYESLKDLRFPYYLPAEEPKGYEILNIQVRWSEGDQCLIATLTDGIREFYVVEFSGDLKGFQGFSVQDGQNIEFKVLYRQLGPIYPLSSLSFSRGNTGISILSYGCDANALQDLLNWILY